MFKRSRVQPINGCDSKMDKLRRGVLRALAFSLATALLCVRAWAELPREIRVVTYNIHHGEGIDGKFDLKRIADVVMAEKPDVVALQEVDQGTKRASGVDQAAEFEKLTGMKVVFGRNIDYDGGGYGTAVLTRLPILSTNSVKLKSYYLPTKQHPEQRGVQVIELGEKDGERVLFMCTHFDWRPPDEERMNSAVTVNELIKKRGTELAIIAGDFNARPDSRVIRELAKEWKIAGLDEIGMKPPGERNKVGTKLAAEFVGHSIPGGKLMLSCPSEKPNAWIDYVMCRPADKWKVVEVRVLDEAVASDHRPVLAVLQRVR
jgi:endonuclease/exonuclease/phosphatase family metal-dependent hydrolase